jgi:hypothetical protein
MIGQSATYIVTVRPATPGGPMPTGTVNLIVDTGSASAPPFPSPPPASLINGNATFVVPVYHVGRLNWIANYSGDGNYSPANSQLVQLNVNPRTPTVTLRAESTTVSAGTRAGLIVSVVGEPNNLNLSLPFGFVTFFDSYNGGKEEAVGPPQLLDFGNGNFMVASQSLHLPVGEHVIRAHYLGQAGGLWPEDWTPADSNLLPVIVK